MTFFSKTIDSARAGTLKMYMDTNAPDRFGEGQFSFLVIYLDCNLSVYGLFLLLSVWMALMESLGVHKVF